jgi:hypothetical protein
VVCFDGLFECYCPYKSPLSTGILNTTNTWVRHNSRCQLTGLHDLIYPSYSNIVPILIHFLVLHYLTLFVVSLLTTCCVNNAISTPVPLTQGESPQSKQWLRHQRLNGYTGYWCSGKFSVCFETLIYSSAAITLLQNRQ